ncbi:hypothetical protein SDC9_174611 [bioreactor metagenome]|uniref:Uncharacterized protein n=1 Tax=bioreactor metagenome TaxID=1076179 RepID=A0A645GT39_9ZZZZ
MGLKITSKRVTMRNIEIKAIATVLLTFILIPDKRHIPRRSSVAESAIPKNWHICGIDVKPSIFIYSATMRPTPTGSMIFVNPEKIKTSPRRTLENALRIFISAYLLYLKQYHVEY